MIRNKVFIPNLKEIIANEWKRLTVVSLLFLNFILQV
jgi:hypothetical protein